MRHVSVHDLPVPRPYDLAGLFAWFAPRAIDGVERVTSSSYARTLRLAGGPAVMVVRPSGDGTALTVEARCAAPADVPAVVRVAAHLFDIAPDPLTVDAAVARHPALAPLVAQVPGIRLPGSTDLAEAGRDLNPPAGRLRARLPR